MFSCRSFRNRTTSCFASAAVRSDPSPGLEVCFRRYEGHMDLFTSAPMDQHNSEGSPPYRLSSEPSCLLLPPYRFLPTSESALAVTFVRAQIDIAKVAQVVRPEGCAKSGSQMPRDTVATLCTALHVPVLYTRSFSSMELPL